MFENVNEIVPPLITRDNPVGSYIKEFSIPKSWQDQQIVIHFGGVSSAYYLWVNGEKVGYAQGSRLPSEFDITEYVKSGNNTLAIQVFRWSDGSYLEDQDHWRISGIHREVMLMAQPKVAINDFDVNKKGNVVTIKTTHVHTDKISLNTTYKVLENGEILVNMQLDADKSLPSLLRVGMTTGINAQFSNMAFYGRGPFENYRDRNQGADLGLYTGTVDEFAYQYVRPQESGNRTDVDWLKLTNNKGLSVKIDGKQPLSMSVWPWSAENIDRSAHSYDLVKNDFNTVNIDLIQAGVGGNDTWSPKAAPIKQFQIPAGKYNYSFSISVK